MIFKLFIDKNCREEIIANVHERTPLVNEIERLVVNDSVSDQIPGFKDDDIVMLDVQETECFVSENDRVFALYGDGKKYLVKRRLYELDELLPDYFERISKSAIANWKKIRKFKVQLSGAVDAEFASGTTECISRRCFAELKRRYGL